MSFGEDLLSSRFGTVPEGMDAEGVRAALLLEDGLGARAHWRSHRGGGVDYATFRAALVAERDARRIAAEESEVDEPRDAQPKKPPPVPMDPNLMSPASVVAAAFRRGADDDDDADGIPVRRISSMVSGFDTDGDDASTRSGRSQASNSTVASNSRAFSMELHQTHPNLIFTPCKSRVTVARWSGLGGEKTLALGRDSGTVELMAPNDGDGGLEFAHELRGHAAAITDLDWSAGGNELVTSSADGDVRHWSKSVDVSQEVSRNEWRCNRSLLGDSAELVDDASVTAVRFHPGNSNMVIVGRADRRVTLVNLSTGAEAARCGANAYMKSAVRCVCVDTSGDAVYAGDDDGKVFALVCVDRNAGGRSKTALARAAAAARPWSLSLVCRARPPGGSGGGKMNRRAVKALTHETFLTVTKGAAVLAAHADGTVRILRAPGMPKPELRPVITVQLPMWPGLGGCVAFAPVVDPSAPPDVAASVSGGGSTAVFVSPSRDGAPAMKGASLSVPGGLKSTAVGWDAGGTRVAVAYDGGGVMVWSRASGNQA